MYKRLFDQMDAWTWPYRICYGTEIDRIVHDRAARKQVELWIICSRRYYLVFVPTVAVLTFAGTALTMLTYPFWFRVMVHELQMFPGAIVFFAFQGMLTVGVLIIVAIRTVMRKELRRALNTVGFSTCIRCGYDLRGRNGDSCPECGEPVVTAVAAQIHATEVLAVLSITLTAVAVLIGVAAAGFATWAIVMAMVT